MYYALSFGMIRQGGYLNGVSLLLYKRILFSLVIHHPKPPD